VLTFYLHKHYGAATLPMWEREWLGLS
jgi:hypothetical protein